MIPQPRAGVPGRGQAQQITFAVTHDDPDAGAGEGEPGSDLETVPEFRCLRAQEFQSGRNRMEEIAHLDQRSFRAAARGDAQDAAAVGLQARASRCAALAGLDPQARDRGDARQRLAAEAEGRHTREILDRGDLAGGVPLDREEQIVPGHAAAVVADPDQPLAGMCQFDGDLSGAGVDAVLEQFLERGGRALHDLAGGHPVDRLLGEDPDAVALLHAGYGAAGIAMSRRRKRSHEP